MNLLFQQGVVFEKKHTFCFGFINVLIIGMKFLFFLIVTIQVIQTSKESASFGLLTVTHSRQGDYSVLQQYLKTYAQKECYSQFITQINLVWNNQQLPEQTVIFQQKENWKIPVHFFKTTFNSMDHRYRLPKQSTAQLLYSLDDDIIVDCQTFNLTLQQYNKVRNGKLGRIVTNQVRGYKFQPSSQENKQFIYQGQPHNNFFTISQPGAAFIPRHYLQLYYLKINQLVQLRNFVLTVKNCDDIFFYAIVQHFYPELPAVYIRAQKDYKNTDPKIGQSKTKDVYPTRNKCINDISKVFGYNPLRFYSKKYSQLVDNWQYDNLQTILQLKMGGFNQVQQEKAVQKSTQQYFKDKKRQEQVQIIQKQAQQKLKKAQLINQQSKQKQKNEKSQKKTDSSEKSRGEKPQKSQKISNNPGKQKEKQQNKQESSIKDNSTGPAVKNSQEQPQLRQQISIKLTFEQQLIIYLFVIGVLLIVSIKLLQKNCMKKTKYRNRIRVNEEEEANTSGITFARSI